jgi:hypothetical protein
LPGTTSAEFNNALGKYVKKTASIFYDAAIDTYDEEYGSFKSTLRSTKFLEKIDSKINNRIFRLTADSPQVWRRFVSGQDRAKRAEPLLQVARGAVEFPNRRQALNDDEIVSRERIWNESKNVSRETFLE